ncbi:hypothetical protein ABW21_db0208257 [Orbilia brochopaga]|nr:hypothetical protein ABW21_db0208257 [Drechslerella brochopaga]
MPFSKVLFNVGILGILQLGVIAQNTQLPSPSSSFIHQVYSASSVPKAVRTARPSKVAGLGDLARPGQRHPHLENIEHKYPDWDDVGDVTESLIEMPAPRQETQASQTPSKPEIDSSALNLQKRAPAPPVLPDVKKIMEITIRRCKRLEYRSVETNLAYQYWYFISEWGHVRFDSAVKVPPGVVPPPGLSLAGPGADIRGFWDRNADWYSVQKLWERSVSQNLPWYTSHARDHADVHVDAPWNYGCLYAGFISTPGVAACRLFATEGTESVPAALGAYMTISDSYAGLDSTGYAALDKIMSLWQLTTHFNWVYRVCGVKFPMFKQIPSKLKLVDVYIVLRIRPADFLWEGQVAPADGRSPVPQATAAIVVPIQIQPGSDGDGDGKRRWQFIEIPASFPVPGDCLKEMLQRTTFPCPGLLWDRQLEHAVNDWMRETYWPELSPHDPRNFLELRNAFLPKFRGLEPHSMFQRSIDRKRPITRGESLPSNVRLSGEIDGEEYEPLLHTLDEGEHPELLLYGYTF